MRVQDFLVFETKRATEAFFETARKVPADKLEWSPLDSGRTVLSQAQECAMSPTWATSIIAAGKFDWDEAKMEKVKAEQESWKTLDDCEAACAKNAAQLIELIEGMPDGRLEETIEIPVGKDPKWRIVDLLHLQIWNLHYHTGQVNYIQTLYGDKSMG
ncbi:MAG TPA: DinB family protein [Fimbriimonadaceae bacterium]|nr:DinB family protein [Fimbriimonadaceae bacterium]